MNNVKKCNLLFANHVSTKKVGGAELVLDNIVSNLDTNKFDTVLVLQKPEDDQSGWNSFNNTAVESFNFGSLKHSNKIISLLSMLFRICLGVIAFYKIFRKYNTHVVVANSLIAAAFTVIPSKIFRKKFIYYEHNIASQRKGHLIGLALRPVAYFSDSIVCISEAVRSSLFKEGIDKHKLHLIHNGYDFSQLDKESNVSEMLPERHRTDVFRIGMVANFMPWKRHNLFLEIVDSLSKRLPEVHVQGILVGACLPGNEEYYHEIRKWINDYKGGAEFQLAGFKTNVADYFRSFDVLINPAQAEPFGLIFIESMYLKCVAVGSIEGAASEIIQDGASGLIVDYSDFESVLNKISNLAIDVDKRRLIGNVASSYVRDKFSIDKQVCRIEELLLSLCN